MKFAHLPLAGRTHLVVQHDGAWHDVSSLLGQELLLDHLVSAPGSEQLLERLTAGVENEPHRYAIADLALELKQLKSPLLQPSKILAIGLNYKDHCREYGVDLPTRPVVFSKASSAIVGHGDVVSWSKDVTSCVDWESELAVVIGKPARNVDEADALSCVFGITLVNDVTARDLQQQDSQWTRAKSLDTFCPIGPVVVTMDDVPDLQQIQLKSRVNGTTMQDSSTSEMIFSVAEIISYVSHGITLMPGDVIATGTPFGVGAFRTPPVYLCDGDVMEMEAPEIGVLRNTCRSNSSA